MTAAPERAATISDRSPRQMADVDPAETQEWRDSLDGVVDHAGRNRARYLVRSMLQRARERQIDVPGPGSTDYINTIPPQSEPSFPGDERIERRIRAYIRWNARDHGAPGAAARDRRRWTEIGPRFVPIIPDEARTFGLDALFPSKKIYNPQGQRYLSVDRDQLLSYQEDTAGVLLHEGITEAGSVASWTAAGTSYATHGEPMIPVYVFYSMFGFQRTGDGLWAAADQMTRGFLLGATAGRTTLNGEGLQHQDGHSLLLASTNPACVAYDAAYGFELGHIVRDGLRRMYGEPHPGEDPNVFYYLTLYNEPILQPPEPDDVDIDGILAGMHRASAAPEGDGPSVQILASGIAVPWALEAQRLLGRDWGVRADVWSVTSWTKLRREALVADEWNLFHPEGPRRFPYITRRLRERPGPAVAVSDWMRAVPDQIAPFVPGPWTALGTDGFGRSDTRPALRRHCRVDAPSIVLRALEQLVDHGERDRSVLNQAIATYRLDEVAAPARHADGGSG